MTDLAGEKAYTELDDGLPLALLPIRIETRYQPQDAPEVLRIRLFPDTIHANGHREGLTEREIEAGVQYWKWVWPTLTADDEDQAAVEASEAQAWLAGQVGPYRAVYVAGRLAPENLAKPTGDPEIPAIDPDEVPSQPVVARLLPDEWMLRIYDEKGTLVHTEFRPAPTEDLTMAPALVSGHDTATGGDDDRGAARGFLDDQDLDWMVHFERAMDVGMAFEVPVRDLPPKIGTLLVTGVRRERKAAAEGKELFDLFQAHRFSRGLDVVPQGTATNNTDVGRSGVSLAAPDIDAIFTAAERPGPSTPRPFLEYLVKEPSSMYLVRSADTLSLAFGHLVPNAFDWSPNAHVADGAAAWAMNMAIAYSTIGGFLAGPLLREDNTSALTSAAIDLRQWYGRWVRGGAVVPTFRCGEQPYGVLPITHRPQEHPGKADFRVTYEHYCARFLDRWRDALPVPGLDPDATDARPASTALQSTADVAAVLGAVPHPTAFQLRLAEHNRQADMAAMGEAIGDVTQALAPVTYGPTPTPREDATDDALARWAARVLFLDGRQQQTDVYAQQVHLDQWLDDIDDLIDLYDDPNVYPNVEAWLENARSITLERIKPLITAQLNGTEALPAEIASLHGSGGIGAEDALKLASTTFADDATAINDVVTVDGDFPLTPLFRWFYAVEREVKAILANEQPPWPRSSFAREAPLLVHLLDLSYRFTPVIDVPAVAFAMTIIRRLAEASQSVYRPNPDPDAEIPDGADGPPGIETNPWGGEVLPEGTVIARLEWLLRETLGLSMYRFDAWLMSMANERLAEHRVKRPDGIQIGAYGWVVDLERSPDEPSQGFIHAPSLSHATTAAVLRAGWSAFGTSGEEAPLSVDLSSDQVRKGQWILDGLRNGQDLGELLGARFERLLHDGERDEWITKVREAALAADRSPDLPNAIVDGLLLARSVSTVDHTDRELAMLTELETRIAASPVGEREGWADARAAAEAVAAELDAVADVVMFQSVHSLLQGDAPSAGAALAISSGADAAVPPIGATSTQRDAQLVGQRVTLSWPHKIASDGTPVLGAASPGVVDWTGRQLPDPDRVTARWLGTEGTELPLSLGDLGLDPIGAALLAGAGADQRSADLGRVVAALVPDQIGHRDGEVDLDWIGPDDALSVNEFGLIAAAFADALGRTRGLRAEDLVVGSEDTGGSRYDLETLRTRAIAVDDELAGLITAIETGADRRIALARAAALGLSGAVTALETDQAAAGAEPDGGTKVTAPGTKPRDLGAEAAVQRVVVLEGLAARRAALVDIVADAGSGALKGAWSDAEGIASALSDAIGARLPIDCPFDPVVDLTSSLDDAALQAEVAATAPTWLRQMARVRASVGATVEAGLLADAVRQVADAGVAEPGPWEPAAAQLPTITAPWSAVANPAGRGEHLSIVNLTGTAPLRGPGPVTGLLVDSWTDAIPRRDAATGVAVHFDAPSARPPQSVLLATVDEKRGFSANEVADQLLFTLELAKIRAAGSQDIGMGQFLPGVFLPDDQVLSDDVEKTP